MSRDRTCGEKMKDDSSEGYAVLQVNIFNSGTYCKYRSVHSIFVLFPFFFSFFLFLKIWLQSLLANFPWSLFCIFMLHSIRSAVSLHTYLTAMPSFSLSKAPLSTLLSQQISHLIPSHNSLPHAAHNSPTCTHTLFFVLLYFFLLSLNTLTFPSGHTSNTGSVAKDPSL